MALSVPTVFGRQGLEVDPVGPMVGICGFVGRIEATQMSCPLLLAHLGAVDAINMIAINADLSNSLVKIRQSSKAMVVMTEMLKLHIKIMAATFFLVRFQTFVSKLVVFFCKSLEIPLITHADYLPLIRRDQTSSEGKRQRRSNGLPASKSSHTIAADYYLVNGHLIPFFRLLELRLKGKGGRSV